LTRFYERLLAKPGRYIAGFIGTLLALFAVPFLFIVQLNPPSITFALHAWDKSLPWATLVLQIGGFVVLVLGGLVPIMKWYGESVEKVVDKPTVVTNLREDGCEIMSIGGTPAVNVWMVVEESDAPIPLGALNANEFRPVSPAVVAILKRNVRHLIISAARPNAHRPYAVTFNVLSEMPFESIIHGFRPQPVKYDSLTRGGSIDQYLHHERKTLIAELKEFSRTVRKETEAGLKAVTSNTGMSA